MHIAKSTASVWLKNLKLKDNAKAILLEKSKKRFFKPRNTEWMKGKKTRPKIWSKEKLKALKKYYNSGLNVREVAKEMGVSHSTINHTMRRNNIPRRSFSEASRIRFSKKPVSYNKKQNLTQKEKYLHIAALMLYWAEGSKKGKWVIDFTNSDEKMVLLFLSALRRIYQIDESRLRAALYCHANQNLKKIHDYWSKLLNIPKTQFSKPYVRTDVDEKKKNKMPHGLIHIRYCDKKLFMQFMSEIDIIQMRLNEPRWLSGLKHLSVEQASKDFSGSNPDLGTEQKLKKYGF